VNLKPCDGCGKGRHLRNPLNSFHKRSLSNLELIEVKTSTTEQVVAPLSFREAILPQKVQELRQKLGRKAKQQPQAAVNAFWKSRL
jgi:hypothetical protein